MKNKLDLFLPRLCLPLVGMFFLYPQHTLSANCSAGHYSYLYAQCPSCPPGCYCPGVSDAPWHGFVDGAVADACKKKANSSKDAYKSIRDKGNVYRAGVRLCPDEYPSSDPNSSSIEDCYTEENGMKIKYSEYVTCNEGEYLPKKNTKCAKCVDRGVKVSAIKRENQYCPGGKELKPSEKEDQGIETCESGSVANSDLTGCLSNSIPCEPGYYLPANTEIGTTKCTQCPSSGQTYCPGGTYGFGNSEDQGKKECKDGSKPNDNRSDCVDLSASAVKPGYYLPAGIGEKQIQCDGSTYYCPGGDYVESADEDQGKFQCPKGTTPNTNKTACSIKINKDRMRVGPSLNTPEEFQCWTVSSDPKQYKSCVLVNKYSQ